MATAPPTDPAPASERYRTIRLLGRGGMGDVYLVHDSVRGEEVARKRTVVGGALNTLRFKREFRAIEHLSHPGLVRLYELGEDADGLYYTMEAIAGMNVRNYCRGVAADSRAADSSSPSVPVVPGNPATAMPPGDADVATITAMVQGGDLAPSNFALAPGGFDPARLALVLPQIVETLMFLHAQGIVHRDLKPDNILVRDDGVTKLLDFGILAEVSADTLEESALGTAAYMAPEQIRGEPATPATDLYALGAVIFEIVAGRKLFPGSQRATLHSHLHEEPARLDDLVGNCPPPLANAVAAMLRKHHDTRISLEEFALTALPAIGARAPIAASPRSPLVSVEGREREQRILLSALASVREGASRWLLLIGATGVGKTTLAVWAAHEAERAGMVVLRGRGRPNDKVAFNAVDGVIDSLAMEIDRRAELRNRSHRARERAGRGFPVLSWQAEPRVAATGSRTEVFDGLVRLLEEAASWSGGVLLLVDDLHWGDLDSAALLRHLADAAPAGVGMVATLRDDLEEGVAESWYQRLPDADRITVEPLGIAALEAVVQRAAQQAGAAPTAEQLREAAQASGGQPILAELAGRALARGASGTRDLTAWLAARVRDAPPIAQKVLAAIVAADGWATSVDLSAVTGHTPGEVADCLVDLTRDGLLRVAGTSGGRADFFHDVVREASDRGLGGPAISAAHAGFANLLESRRGVALERRVRHLLGAGRNDEAAILARQAATRAESNRAFSLAADMYEVALEHGHEDRATLLRARAEALGSSARYREAATVWHTLAGETRGESANDAAFRHAHSLLAADQVDLGRARLDEALIQAGEAPLGHGSGATLAAVLPFLFGPRRRRRHAAPDKTLLRRAEHYFLIGQMLVFFDGRAGLRFIRRAYRTFDRLGADEQAARCELTFAYFAYLGGKRGRVRLAERYRRAMIARLDSLETITPLISFGPRFLEGIEFERAGQWRAAADALDDVLAALDDSGGHGTFEQMIALIHRTDIDFFSQNLAGMVTGHARFRAIARDSNEPAACCYVDFFGSALAWTRGEFDRARAILHRLQASLPRNPPTVQASVADIYCAFIDVYDRDCHEARRQVAPLLKSGALRMVGGSVVGMAASLAALIEANALGTGDPHASYRRVRTLARMCDRTAPWMPGPAERALAYAADTRGDTDRAIELLDAAERRARREGRTIDIEISRYQRGLRLGGAAGDELRNTSRAAMTELGASVKMLTEDARLR